MTATLTMPIPKDDNSDVSNARVAAIIDYVLNHRDVFTPDRGHIRFLWDSKDPHLGVAYGANDRQGLIPKTKK